MIQITRHPTGRQLTVLGFRVHHYHFAFAALAFAAWALIVDRRDFLDWAIR